MGTRGAFGVKSNGKYYVTYNHFDSYPDALGQEMVNMCRDFSKDNLWEKLAKRFSKVVLVNDYGNKKPTEKQIERYVANGFCKSAVSSGSLEEWYCLLRGTQNGVAIKAILDGKLNHLINSFDFLKDSLFCEYAYIMNLDDHCLEFYEGFNHEPDKNSPFPFEQVDMYRDREYATDSYYPVRFNGMYLFEAIPDNWMDLFKSS